MYYCYLSNKFTFNASFNAVERNSSLLVDSLNLSKLKGKLDFLAFAYACNYYLADIDIWITISNYIINKYTF